MKQHDNKWKIRLASLALAGVCLCGAALAVGDKNDPLISLSYLNQKAIPAILQQVETKAQTHKSELAIQFDNAIDGYKAEKESGALNNASYKVVTLKKSQKMELGVGCEIMLRIGTAQITSATFPALVDISTAESVSTGASLRKNHLYLATIPDRVLTATSYTTKVLVRGNYVIL